MAYDPTKPRETSPVTSSEQRKPPRINPWSALQRRGQTATRLALQIGEPTEEKPYGTGLGYDPKDPRNTARGSKWIKDHSAFGLGTHLTQRGINALYRQNPNYELAFQI